MDPNMQADTWILTVLFVGLGIAVVTDLMTHRIPNWLTFGLVLIALVLQFWLGQWNGLLLATGGLMVGLLCFLPSYLFGMMGAGDVKLMAAVGAVLGPWATLIAVLSTLVAGGVIALGYIGRRGGLVAIVRRYGCMFFLLVQRQPQYLPPEPNEAAAQRFPYALAIASGSALSLWYTGL
jgi:prepilin peptidase CpaA